MTPLKKGYEKVSIPARVQLLKDLVVRKIPYCWYLRPLVEEWFDPQLMHDLASQLVPVVKDHIILSGIVMSTEIEDILKSQDPSYPAGLRQD